MSKKSTESKTSQALAGGAVEQFDQWRRRAGRLNEDAVVKIINDPVARNALYGAFAHTQYLAQCCLSHPDAAIEALVGNPSEVLSQVARDLRALDRVTGPTTALARAIRPLKERAVVAIGLADISGKWGHDQIGSSLSDLAERTLDAGLGWLTRLAYRHGEFTAQEELAPVPVPGLFVLGGGDLAAEEPGYVGPLEVIVLYDPEVLKEAAIGASERVFSRIAGELADALGLLNKDGSIFELVQHGRILRNESATGKDNLALSVAQVVENLKNDATPFERAWFASVRVVAGDRNAGQAFIETISQGIWKKGLDADEIREAVASVGEKGSIKKKSDKSEQSKENTKNSSSTYAHWRLVQTCRLALGQNHEEFRHGTARKVFEEAGRIGAMDTLTADRLASNADFYSMSRNRLQLIRGDAQEEISNKEQKSNRASLCGFTEVDRFEHVLRGTISEAEQHWLNIAAGNDTQGFDVLGGNGAPADTNDQEAYDIGNLENMGFADGRDIATTVDNWLSGSYANSDDEPRNRLSQLAPGLLSEFAATQDPDMAITNFDRLLALLSDDVKPFDLLRTNTNLCSSVVDLFGNMPRYGEILIGSPDLVGEVLDETWDVPVNAEDWLDAYPLPRRHGSDDQILAALSDWLWESRTRLCLAWTRGAMELSQAGSILSALSQAAVALVYDICVSQSVAAGNDLGKGLAIVAMGDFGGANLVADAPLDLVFVYDPDGKAGASAGAVQNYTGLASAITECLTKLRKVADGLTLPLFEVDTRSRPGGTGGEIASSLRVYKTYYVGQADARAQLGLTRARVICGPKGLSARIDDATADMLTRPRQGDQLPRDADRGRSKDLRHNRPESTWDVERIRGGLADLEIIVQCMQVKYGAEHPYVFSPNLSEALSALGRSGCLDGNIVAELSESTAFWQRLRAVQGLTGMNDPTAKRPRQRMAKLIARAVGVSDFTSVEPLIRGHAERTQMHYNHLILGHQPDNSVDKAAVH